MSRKHTTFVEKQFQTAEELWLALSPTNKLRAGSDQFNYRGQGDSRWLLVPTILRPRNQPPIVSYEQMVNASQMVFAEINVLERFAKHCDAVGIPIPNDSQNFRSFVLTTDASQKYYNEPSLWPNPEVLDLMAMAQHHGVPTRLLDWTTRAYTAAYFAASSALARFNEWNWGERLCVWAMDEKALKFHDKITLHRSPGSISRHLAAQGGLFSVHPHTGSRGEAFSVTGLETHQNDIAYSAFIKLTLPVYESAELLRLCSIAGFNAATIYPTADGAGRAVIDDMNRVGAKKRWNDIGHGTLVR